jgi:lipopolysaccharide export system protein LptA
MRLILGLLVTLAFSVGSATVSSAQGTSLDFGNKTHDIKQQVEIVADTITFSQNRGLAEFLGNVVVGQGDLRLAADKIVVEYSKGDGGATSARINRMIATGKVTLVAGDDAVEADTAIYSPDDGLVEMEGDVLVTQGANAISGQKVTISLADGSARIEGRVRTVFQPGASE